VDHGIWDSLLKTYVDSQGLVDYSAWAESPRDRANLKNYLAQFEKAGPAKPGTRDPDYRIAALANLYNALTIGWILENYPVVSIRKTKRPWKEQRFQVGGRWVSLDEIEHDTLRPLIGWKVHSMVVCAARSCPPLQREAFREADWENQMEAIYRIWLSREDLNHFLPDRQTARVSKIFSWFAVDFQGEATLQVILRRFGPPEHQSLFEDQDLKIRFMEYHWGLNDQSGLGSDYNHGWF
jgi:hypothetical protein